MPKKSVNLPTPPSLIRTIGPSFILLGLALGSGELILWPYLAANYGLGLLWGALLGVSFQFVLNTEVMRYTLAWGESVFVGFRKISILIPLWFIISTFIPWSLPGFSSAASDIINRVFPFIHPTVAALGLLILTGVLLTMGKTLYRTMEIFQKSVILIGLPFMAILAFLITNSGDWSAAASGLLGVGDGWMFFPTGVSFTAFLGAFAYAGAGGNLNLAQSYYIKEKGFGMGKFGSGIKSLISVGDTPLRQGSAGRVEIEGYRFKDSAKNNKLWKKWWGLVNKEHFLVFWTLGFLTIVMMSVLARSLVYGTEVESGLSFLYAEADAIGSRLGSTVGVFFMLISALVLFSTQVGVLESSSRIISENILLLFYKKGKKFNVSLAFYLALWAQIGLGMVFYLTGFKEPRMVLTTSAVLNGAAMMVSFPLIWWLNRSKLPGKYGPSLLRKLIMLAAFLFFVIFVFFTING